MGWNRLFWACNFVLWAEQSVWLKSKQAKPLNTPTNLKVHNSASPLKAFRVTSDTTQKKNLQGGAANEQSRPDPEAESQHHWFSTGNKQKILHSWGEEYSGESL